MVTASRLSASCSEFLGDEFEGTMTVEGGIDPRPEEGGPLAGTGLHRDLVTGNVTPFAVIPVAPQSSAPTAHFASFPVGGDYQSAITLINPSSITPTRGTLALLDPAGQPRAIAVNGQAAATSSRIRPPTARERDVHRVGHWTAPTRRGPRDRQGRRRQRRSATVIRNGRSAARHRRRRRQQFHELRSTAIAHLV